MRVPFFIGILALAGAVSLGAEVARADKPKLPLPDPVCTGDKIDQLPVGTPLGVTDAFLEDVRRQVAPNEEDRKNSHNAGYYDMDHSRYAEREFSVFFNQRVFLDEAKTLPVDVTCRFKGTAGNLENPPLVIRSLATVKKVEQGRYETVENTHYDKLNPFSDYKGPLITYDKVFVPYRDRQGNALGAFRKMTWELGCERCVLPLALICEVASGRVDDKSPYTPYDQAMPDIATLSKLLAGTLPLLAPAETDAVKCSAITTDGAMKEASVIGTPRGGARPLSASIPSKSQLSEPPTDELPVDDGHHSSKAKAPGH